MSQKHMVDARMHPILKPALIDTEGRYGYDVAHRIIQTIAFGWLSLFIAQARNYSPLPRMPPVM